MDQARDALAPKAVLASWLAAAAACPAALAIAAVGQGVGGWLGGCGWIGVALPPHLQTWALVNQPNLAFAARPNAIGYWLGSLLLPALVAALAVPAVPRPRTVAAELLVLQVAWFAVVVDLAWQPLLDLHDGHLARWLSLRRLPETLVWLPAAAAAAAALVPAWHLLALVGVARRHARRLVRLAAVGVHLLLPAAAFVGLASLLGGRLPVLAATAVGGSALVALGLAWVGPPRPVAHALEPIHAASLARLASAALLLVALIGLAGRPLPGRRSTGLLWRATAPTNNLRPWVEPLLLPWVRTAGPGPGPGMPAARPGLTPGPRPTAGPAAR